jgi:site-specific recombinase XerC
LQSEGHSVSHCARVKSAVGGFARWLIEDKQLLRRNPAGGVELPAQPLLAPRELSPDQRYVLHSLVERREDVGCGDWATEDVVPPKKGTQSFRLFGAYAVWDCHRQRGSLQVMTHFWR